MRPVTFSFRNQGGAQQNGSILIKRVNCLSTVQTFSANYLLEDGDRRRCLRCARGHCSVGADGEETAGRVEDQRNKRSPGNAYETRACDALTRTLYCYSVMQSV